MIITGKSIAFSLDLMRRLLDDTAENTGIEALEYRDVPVWEVEHALRHMQILCTATKGTKGLYHAKIRPAPDYTLTHEQWLHAADVLEAELGLDGQPRLIVLHEQDDRAHLHVIWARTDLDTLTLRTDSFTYAAHERAARAIEAVFGHDPVPSWRDPQPDDGRDGAP